MTANTFYIEYVIVGGLALLAIFLGLTGGIQGFIEIQALGAGTAEILAAIPLAYVAGIVVDSFGAIFLEMPLRRLTGDKITYRIVGRSGTSKRSRTADIIHFDNNLATALSRKRSRDRIVRGAFISLALYAVLRALPIGRDARGPAEAGPDLAAAVVPDAAIAAGLSVFLLLAWIYFHNATRDFKTMLHRKVAEADDGPGPWAPFAPSAGTVSRRGGG